jgi:hypothetical protein
LIDADERLLTKNLQEDALQALLSIIQPAAQVRHDLDVGECGILTMPLKTDGLRLKLFALVMGRERA